MAEIMKSQVVPPADQRVPQSVDWHGKVLIVGPGRRTEGGITSVISRIQPCLDADPSIEAVWIETHRSGNRLAKATQAAIGVVRMLQNIPGADIVHIHSSAELSFIRKSAFFWLARMWRKPVVWHLHSPDIDFRRFFARPGVIGRYARSVLGSCEQVIVLSDSWLGLARETLPGANLRVIYNPVPATPQDFRGSAVRDPHRILYLAHLIPRKGYSFLIRAFAKIAEQFPDSRLVFAGSGEVEQARGLCRELGIEARVDFLGWIGEPERTEELGRSGMLVLPSFQEGLPMGVLEAMKYGLAVVTTPVGGIPDVVSDGYNGFLVPPGDTTALAAAMARLLADDALRERVGSAAQQSVGAFEPAVLAEAWKAIYSNVTATATRR